MPALAHPVRSKDLRLGAEAGCQSTYSHYKNFIISNAKKMGQGTCPPDPRQLFLRSIAICHKIWYLYPIMKIKTFLFYICFLSYFSLLLYLLFFSGYRQSVEGEIAYNLVPFRTIGAYFRSFDGFTLTDPFIGNILAFLPFGFFLPILWRMVDSVYKAVLWAFFLSLSVEGSQFLFRVGAFDVDDLLLNTLGGGLGFGLFWIVRKTWLIFKA